MNHLALASLTVVVISAVLIGLIRRNLRQRPRARELRAIFIAMADDLVSKPELPDAYAKQLAELAAVPGGWITRLMLMMSAKRVFTGTGLETEADLPLSGVPDQLRPKYVVAVLALTLSDTYRCAILGRIWRGTNAWVVDLFNESKRPDVKSDVNAHATRQMVGQITNVHAPRQLRAAERGLEYCYA